MEVKPAKVWPLYMAGAAVVAFLLQIGANHFSRQFKEALMLLDYGPRLVSLALLEVLCGGLSGAMVALALVGAGGDRRGEGRSYGVTALVLGVPALLALLIKFNMALNLLHLPLRYLWLWDWGLYSQAPAFWLGVVAGWWIGRRVRT